MKNVFGAMTLVLVLSSCQSMKSIQDSPNCHVWLEQKYLGPYSTEVIEKSAKWEGSCRTADYRCRTVNISFDEDKNVLKDDTIIGKIENNTFTKLEYTPKEPVQKLYSEKPLYLYSSAQAFPETKKIKATLVNKGESTEVEYLYSEKCSTEQAIAGSIALGLIEQIQKAK